MKSDIEIARSVELKKIKQVAESIGIPREEVENYGRYIAKIPEQLIDEEKVKKSNLVLVTAITATKAGIGKTTSIYRSRPGTEQNRKEGDCRFARAVSRSLLRYEGRSSGWGICTGASDGEDQPSFYGRLSCDYFRA